MTLTPALSASIGFCFALSFSVPIAAQESTTYAGYLNGSCSSWRNRAVEISISGSQVKGSYENQRGGGSRRFSGELNGSKFSIRLNQATNNTASVTGSIEAEGVEVRVDEGTCNARAFLKKKS